MSVKIQKNIMCAKKDYIWNPDTCSCENSKYVWSFIDNSVITCDKIIEETKTVWANFNEIKVTCKTKNLYTLLIILNITIALLIAFSIYCYLIKKTTEKKKNHLLPYYITNGKLKNVL